MGVKQKIQPVAGLSSSDENIVLIIYPSIAATGLGRLLGRLYDCIPLKINGIKLSHLLFTWPTAPIALLLYLWLKIAGARYIVTNRSVRKSSSLGTRLLGEASLEDIADIELIRRGGQAFYRAADLDLCDKNGDLLLRLEGVGRAEVFRRKIEETRDARSRVEASLAAIRARGSA